MALPPIKYVTTGDHGAGTGAPLSAADVDGNFYTLTLMIADAAAAAGTPVGIAAVSVTGSSMSVTLTDASVLGPFRLPVATWNFRGDFTATAYSVYDVVKVPSVGLFLVLQAHSGVLPFDPERAISGQPVYRMLMPAAEQAVRLTVDVAGATYTLQASDKNKLLRFTNAGGCTVTVPPDVFAANDEIYALQAGASVVTFAAGAGVTFDAKPNRELWTDGEGAMVVFKLRSGNAWIRTGEFEGV